MSSCSRQSRAADPACAAADFLLWQSQRPLGPQASQLLPLYPGSNSTTTCCHSDAIIAVAAQAQAQHSKVHAQCVYSAQCMPRTVMVALDWCRKHVSIQHTSLEVGVVHLPCLQRGSRRRMLQQCSLEQADRRAFPRTVTSSSQCLRQSYFGLFKSQMFAPQLSISSRGISLIRLCSLSIRLIGLRM